jgi:subfamily B ATP-binding cassette protein MsbA
MASEPDSATPKKPEKKKNAWKSLPDVWALIKPRRGLLAMGFALMVVNRVCGLVLPASTKYFVDLVAIKHQVNLLTSIVLAVLGATIIQGLTSFTLTQLLSKSAQKMITELRRQVQAHIGRLPISFYDANKTGVLVSRIMSDVEGVRNLVGTGLVEFVGGLMTAIFALVYLIHASLLLTGVAFFLFLALASAKPSPRFARFSAPGQKSPPKSPDVSPNRLVASAS